jgi:MFS family permease
MTKVLIGRSTSIRSRTFSALDNSDYRRYYFGQGVSLIGTWLQAAAVNWMVFETTDSEFALGVVGAASLLPGLVVGLVAGALADRVAPRRLIVTMEVAQMGLAFTLAALVWFGIVQIWQMALILALARVCVTFEMPSRQVFLYDLVGREDLTNAIALNSGLFNASRVVGPALAGACFAALGATACFLLNGVSYLAAIAAILLIRRPATPCHRGDRGAGQILGGLAHLRRDPRLATLFLLMTFFGVVGMGYDAMIPAYASRVVGTGVRGYSILLASSGIGATVGALAVASLGGVRRKERLILSGLILFAISLAASAMVPPLAARAGYVQARLALASLCLLGVGFGAVVFYSSTQTLIQMVVPDHLRGRIMGIWMIVYSGSVPLGSLWTGRLASSQGVPLAMGLSACLCLLVGLGGLMHGLSGRKGFLEVSGLQGPSLAAQSAGRE